MRSYPRPQTTRFRCPECLSAMDGIRSERCSHCGWKLSRRDGIPVLLSESDRTSDLFASYMENYEQIAKDDLSDHILSEDYLAAQAANLIGVLGSSLQGARVCDVGAGKGYLARAMSDAGAESVTAVDIALPYLMTLKGSRIRPILANAENLPFVDEFDILTSSDVAEHVLNLSSFVYCASRALKRGGLFVLRVPYRENILSYAPQLGCPYRFVHLRSFDKSILRDLFQGSGFEIDKFRLDGFWMSKPRSFWSATPMGRLAYDWWQSSMRDRLKAPTDVTRWPPWVAGVLMQPQEIVVRARKIREIAPKPGGGYELT